MSHPVLRVGIAGYGVIGKRRRTWIDANSNLKTVAVSDRSFGGAGRLSDGVNYFSDYRELFASDLDVLFVCLPNDVAPAATIAGIQRGMHVFCEKPPGRSPADALLVRAAANAHPALKVKYGFNHRYHDSVQEALRLVRGGEFGGLVNLRGVYGKSDISPATEWRAQRSFAGGGILLDQGIHMVDIMRLFAGDFAEVHSFISNRYWKYDVEDNAYALMKTAGGVVAMLHSSATLWRRRFNLEITLERATISLVGLLTSTKTYGPETITVAFPSSHDGGDPMERSTRYIDDHSWKDEINEFAELILNERPVVNGSVDDAVKTIELVFAIYRADPEWREMYQL